jgi:dTMP kinase
MAYQGGGRGLSATRLSELAHWTVGDLKPDLTFLFDVPVDIAMLRLFAGTPNPDRFEREQAEFFERVRTSYLAIAAAEPQRVRVIDARLSLSEIQVILENIIASY